nr:zinc-binding dehydrogenase [Zhengella mangrovi]
MMKALLQTNDGFADRPSPMQLEGLDPYVELAETPVPVPGEGQVLIKVKLASVNPADVMFIKGMYGQRREKGKPAGFEGVGEVVASGGGAYADSLKGKRIAFIATHSGAWADYALADAAVCIPLRDDIRDADGAAMIVNPLTAHAMFDIVKKEGEKAFVMSAAASQLCKLIARMAADEGFRPIALVRRDDQIDLLKSHGAAHVLNVTAPDFARQLAEVLKAEKPRIFLDAVTGKLAGQVFAAMGRGARWIVYGRLDGSDTVIPEPGQLIFMGKRIEGFWLTQWKRQASMEENMAAAAAVQARFASGEWKTDVTAIVPLSEAHARLAGELEKPNGKVFLVPG